MKDFSLEDILDTELHLPTRHIVQIILEGFVQIFRHRILQRIVVRRTRALSFRDRQELILLITQNGCLYHTPITIQQIQEVSDIETKAQSM